jgi:hypothetical protein
MEGKENSKDRGTKLPEIGLEPSPGNTRLEAHFMIRHSSTEPLDRGSPVYVGSVSVVMNDQDQTAYIKYVTIYDFWRTHETLRFGYAAYLGVIEFLLSQNPPLRLTSGHMLSEDANRIWEKFVDMGIATCTRENTYPPQARARHNWTDAKYELI